MSHKKGARLDGIVSIEDVRLRCFIDEETGCWHLRTARGTPLPRDGKRQSVWLHGIGHETVTRAVWMLSRPGKELKNGWRCFRTCNSYDCASPRHISAGNGRSWGRHMSASGKASTPAKVAAARAVPKPHQKLTPELKQWLLESQQTSGDLGHALDLTEGRVRVIRSQHRKAVAARPACSIFDFAMKAAA